MDNSQTCLQWIDFKKIPRVFNSYVPSSAISLSIAFMLIFKFSGTRGLSSQVQSGPHNLLLQVYDKSLSHEYIFNCILIHKALWG